MNPKKTRAALILLLLSTFSMACSSSGPDALIKTSSLKISSKKYPAISPSEVLFYMDTTEIKDRHEKLAILFASGTNDEEHQIYESMRKSAAAIGANGILFQSMFSFDNFEDRSAEMVAIRVSEKETAGLGILDSVKLMVRKLESYLEPAAPTTLPVIASKSEPRTTNHKP